MPYVVNYRCQCTPSSMPVEICKIKIANYISVENDTMCSDGFFSHSPFIHFNFIFRD